MLEPADLHEPMVCVMREAYDASPHAITFTEYCNLFRVLIRGEGPSGTCRVLVIQDKDNPRYAWIDNLGVPFPETWRRVVGYCYAHGYNGILTLPHPNARPLLRRFGAEESGEIVFLNLKRRRDRVTV